MYDFDLKFPGYSVTPDGNVFEGDKQLVPFHSNGYLQVNIKSAENKRKRAYGVHTLVAMNYLPDYFEGCIVHHKDGNRQNNILDNLMVLTQSKHAKLHVAEYNPLVEYVKTHDPHNKGKKMSKEYCEARRLGAIGKKFRGNQYVDANGNHIED